MAASFLKAERTYYTCMHILTSGIRIIDMIIAKNHLCTWITWLKHKRIKQGCQSESTIWSPPIFS